MAFKFLVFIACIAACKAVAIGVAPAPLLHPGYGYPAVAKVAAPYAVKKVVTGDDYDPNPQYSYSYDIHDALTGDNKSQQESRNGDVVTGSYSLVEPDGTRRIVEYTADPVNGFNAVVHKEGAVVKAVKAVAPVAKIAAPLAFGHPTSLALAHGATLGYPAYPYHG
ncbi:larval cuticle protein A3A-like [Culicoides brevitarsis]|uniref:larval cuticle protein A3A-like n=1 Tax=Culicoides brevitarsis TaxID=469753 RepID=UPI00307B4CC1